MNESSYGQTTRPAGRTQKKASLLGVSLAAILPILIFGGCDNPMKLGSGSLEINVEKGAGWLHKHPLFLGLSMYTPPQIAVWVEDASGNYVKTIYVSKKSATQAWLSSAGEGLSPAEIRRPEALPAWSHRRGIVYADGLYMPTSDKPVTDALCSATPKSGFSLAHEPADGLRKFRILAEFNQSLDFNDAYPAAATKGQAGYSGGAFGSGQPSLVYYADIDLDAATESYTFSLLGQGSADGSDGSISTLSGITDAKDIVAGMSATVVR